MVKKKLGGGANGAAKKRANSGGLSGARGTRAEKQKNTSVKKIKSSRNILMHGEEPKELLLALLWSVVETLVKKEMAKIYKKGKDIIVIVFGVNFDEKKGFEPYED